MARARLLVNCPVCEMVRPFDHIRPHSPKLRIATHEITSGGRARIRNAVIEVDDPATRRMVLEHLIAVLHASLDELEELATL